mmetsp:Transcript_23349/g.60897  ORF Transcript_23349/g.60897 Transcript_23349/m.60897 type:complete len:277 (+) Transcript_23349:494-1324(+)
MCLSPSWTWKAPQESSRRATASTTSSCLMLVLGSRTGPLETRSTPSSAATSSSCPGARRSSARPRRPPGRRTCAARRRRPPWGRSSATRRPGSCSRRRSRSARSSRPPCRRRRASTRPTSCARPSACPSATGGARALPGRPLLIVWTRTSSPPSSSRCARSTTASSRTCASRTTARWGSSRSATRRCGTPSALYCLLPAVDSTARSSPSRTLCQKRTSTCCAWRICWRWGSSSARPTLWPRRSASRLAATACGRAHARRPGDPGAATAASLLAHAR